MPKVSVIIPTYNHAEYITEAIDSVLNQTHKDFEIIVVDDGSTDNTKEVLKPYINTGKIIYFYQENKGLSAARNAGINIAKGIFLKFLDSDDILYPKQLELQLMDLTKRGTNISMTNYEFLYSDGRKRSVNIRIDNNHQLTAFIEGNKGTVHSFMLRKNIILDVGGFDESLKLFEDYDLWLRFLINGAKISKVDYIGCCYRILDGSKSSDRKKMFFQRCKAFEKINCILLSKFNYLSEDVIDELLWQNIKLLHKCFVRKQKVHNNLFFAIQMIQKIFSLRKRGMKLFLSKILGIRCYSYLQYMKYNFINNQYKQGLLTEETEWRSDKYGY